MRLTSVEISHYKSLSTIQLMDVSPLTLLVGANGAGKSNVIDVLRFLRDMVKYGLDHAFANRGGVGAVRQYSARKPFDIGIKVCFIDEVQGKPVNGFYELVIGSVSGGFKIKREMAQWCDTDVIMVDEGGFDEVIIDCKFLRREDGSLTLNGFEFESKLPADQQALGVRSVRGRVGAPIAAFFERFRFFSIFPNTLREPSRSDNEKLLKESGENWAATIRALKKTSRGRESLARIHEMMQCVMPNLQEVVVRSVGAYLVPQFRIKDEASGKVHDFDPVQISDGTLRVFGILLALYQQPTPPLIALEEPEQTVHPGVLAMLAEVFREVSGQTQLLITTHSPYLVDFFQLDEIKVVSIKDGITQVSSVKSSQVESVKEGLISLHELMMAEGLLPEVS